MEQNFNNSSASVASRRLQAATTKQSKERVSTSGEVHSVTRRLRDELRTMMMNPVQGISAFPDSDNMLSWLGTVTGPAGTVYEDLVFKVSIQFPSSYPFTAPTIKFETLCYHPNVDLVGNICLDILKEKWSAVYNVQTILLSLQSLLGEPNNDSPLNPQAASLWDNQEEFKKVLLKKYNEFQASQK